MVSRSTTLWLRDVEFGPEYQGKCPAATFGGTAGAAIVCETTADQLPGEGEELFPTFPLHVPAVHEAQVDFIHQGGGLKRAARGFRREERPRRLLELVS